MADVKAMLFGYMLGDGWCSVTTKYVKYKSKKFGDRYYKNTIYQSGFSGDPRGLEIIKKDLMDLLGDIGKATIFTGKTKSPSWGIEGQTSKFACNTEVTKFFIELGMPIGNRVDTEWLIPDWIVNGSLETKASFLSGLYAAEGTTFTTLANGKTMRAPRLVLTKAAELDNNLRQLGQQLNMILEDLKLEHTIRCVPVNSKCGKRIRLEITFKNNYDNILRLIDTLDLRYAPEKAEEARFMKLYHQAKQAELERLAKLYEEVMNPTETVRDIARKHGLNEGQLYNWRRRKAGIRLPNDFPTYADFKRQLSHV